MKFLATWTGEIDAKHARLMSAFVAATRSGDLNVLTELLASDVRVVTDGGGKVAAALNVLDGADRAARFLIGAKALQNIMGPAVARHTRVSSKMNRRALLVLPLLLSAPGCVVVGGYSNTGGWLFWPGGLVISVLLIFFLVFLARRRRL